LNGGASVRAGGGAIIRAAVLVAVALAAVNATGSSAQSFPVKPVRVVVPLVPGGNLDPQRGGGERDARPQRWHQSSVSVCSASLGD